MPHASTTTIYIPPNPPSPAFSASLKTSAWEKPVSTRKHSSADIDPARLDELRESTVRSSSISNSKLPVPSPPSSPQSISRGVSRLKSPCPPRGRFWNRKWPPRPLKRPALKITNPKTTPVDPFNKTPPSYDQWHPTSVVWEYQLQRGLGTSERVFALCRFFNAAGCEREGRRVGNGEVWKGHEGRVEWLFWYWEEALKVKRERAAKEAEEMRGIEEERLVKGVEKEGKTDLCVDEDELTMEEKDLVKTLEEEMEEASNACSEEEEWTMVRDVIERSRGCAASINKRKRTSTLDVVK
ncbi:MAG: hypothetical protein Q9185_004930 [Variospora sp. 1 TL-2023]